MYFSRYFELELSIALVTNTFFAALNFQHSIFDVTCRSNDTVVVVQCACFSLTKNESRLECCGVMRVKS